MRYTKFDGFIKYMMLVGALAFVLDFLLLNQVPVIYGLWLFPIAWLADVAIQALFRSAILNISRPCLDCPLKPMYESGRHSLYAGKEQQKKHCVKHDHDYFVGCPECEQEKMEMKRR